MKDISQDTANIDIILQDPKFVELSLQVMSTKQDLNEDYLIPFMPDDEDENGNKIVYTRQGDYGNELSYVPVKYIRQRADAAFNKKWSFFIIAEKREGEPFDKWSKKDNEYIDGDNYIKCIGMMVVPGLGIRMEYGVKKVFGGGESSDWKACKTDAFKKCCEAFGIYLDYEMEDTESSGTSNSSNKKNNKRSKLDVSDIEYSDDELEEAMQYELNFGKYDGYTLDDIATDDLSYIEWLADKAREDDVRDYCLIILAYYKEQEEEKNKSRIKRNKKKTDAIDRKSHAKKQFPKRKKNTSQAEDENDYREALINECEAAFDDVDDVQKKAIIGSISVSNKYPNGKTSIKSLTISELKELADILDIDS